MAEEDMGIFSKRDGDGDGGIVNYDWDTYQDHGIVGTGGRGVSAWAESTGKRREFVELRKDCMTLAAAPIHE